MTKVSGENSLCHAAKYLYRVLNTSLCMTLSQKDEKDAANEYFVNTEGGPRDWWKSLRRGVKVQPTQHDDYIAQLQEFRRQLDDMRKEYETTIHQLKTDNAAKDSEISRLREVCEQSIAKQQEWERENNHLLSWNTELIREKKVALDEFVI
jgi:hypothetical protein